ncbi:MAG: hypothetical protein LBQ83_03740 [Candidatus Margulisbacteria bacterium]|jgi:predicted HTH transcriptional regulator|nr:hypothetical protein [Candidatus Margulisiibacteriota bacterium]
MIQMLEWPKFLTLINSRDVAIHSVPQVSMSQDITKKAVELANKSGGYLTLGFDRYSLQLYGCNFDSKWLNAILANEIKPAICFEILGFIRNNKRIFVVKIEEGAHKPHSIFGGSLFNVREKQARTTEDVSLDSVKKRQTRCLEYLDTHQDISNSQYRDINEVSYKTAHNELSDLVEKKILGAVGQGRNTKYILYKNLPAYTLERSEVNLFGETLDALIDLNRDSKSKTGLRKAQNIENMESHIIKNSPDFTENPEDSRVIPVEPFQPQEIPASISSAGTPPEKEPEE